MIFGASRVIFLHLPKTAGNSIQRVLEPASDDRIVAKPRQDGVDSFGVSGPITPKKHAGLDSYAARLGPGFSEFRVAIGCRNPLDRALSGYFSRSKGWKLDRFLRALQRMRTAEDMLQVGGVVRRPDWVIRFESLGQDFAAFVSQAGLPVDPASLGHANKTSITSDEIEEARQDPVVRRAVQTKFAIDYELFGYPHEA